MKNRLQTYLVFYETRKNRETHRFRVYVWAFTLKQAKGLVKEWVKNTTGSHAFLLSSEREYIKCEYAWLHRGNAKWPAYPVDFSKPAKTINTPQDVVGVHF